MKLQINAYKKYNVFLFDRKMNLIFALYEIIICVWRQFVHTFLSYMILNINMNLKNDQLDNILWIKHNNKYSVCSVVYYPWSREILHTVANNYGLVDL